MYLQIVMGLAQMGLRPIILERGKVVRERTVDTFAFWRKQELNTNSAIVVGITPEDFPHTSEHDGILAGVALQRHWEKQAFELGGSSYQNGHSLKRA